MTSLPVPGTATGPDQTLLLRLDDINGPMQQRPLTGVVPLRSQTTTGRPLVSKATCGFWSCAVSVSADRRTGPTGAASGAIVHTTTPASCATTNAVPSPPTASAGAA